MTIIGDKNKSKMNVVTKTNEPLQSAKRNCNEYQIETSSKQTN